MKSLIPFLLLLFLASCNQVGIGAGAAVKNFFKSPVDGVQGIFTEKAYEEKVKITQEEKSQNKQNEILYCIDEAGKPVDTSKMSDLEKLSKSIQDVACKCEAWGTCPTNLCSCSIQCPKGFDIFRHPSEMEPEKISTTQNGLSFRNYRIPSKHQQTQGYCWGHSRVTSQFNRLAFFKPGQKAPYDIDSQDTQEQEKAINYYKQVVDKVTQNQAVDIPGFPDLQTFSDHPALQSYIADKVAKTWADHAMSWQGLKTAVKSKQASNAEYEKLFKDVKQSLDMNMQPTVVFTARNSNFLTHASLVSHYKTLPDGKMVLCMRDNNHPEHLAASCTHHMSIDPKKGLVYSDKNFDEIGGITIAHNDKSDAVSQAESLREKCLNEKGCSAK